MIELWKDISLFDTTKKQIVFVAILNEYNKQVIQRVLFIPKFSKEIGDIDIARDYLESDFDNKNGNLFIKEGFYEYSYESDMYICISDQITHFFSDIPLPKILK